MIKIRTGQAPAMLDRQAFGKRFRLAYADPLFEGIAEALAQVEEVAWQAYATGRKSPRTERAGEGFDNPDFELSSEWLATRSRLLRAQEAWSNPETPTRILLVCGASRNDGTCPGEMSKTFRLLMHIREVVAAAGVEPDVLDLSLLASEYGRHIHPCKGCVSTAMPLCHWPCSCYPNHGLNP
ncbi:MAG: NADPH-dependent FMN reductase, partial [Hydrogenophilales bacterium 12-63-5]